MRADVGRVRAVGRYVRRSGPGYVAAKAATYLAPWALGRTGAVGDPFVADLARHLGLPVASVADPNVAEVVEHVAQPETLLVSVSCPLKLGVPLLEAADLGAVNVHSSPLPAYAGLAPYLWVLANGETTTAVTVHEMEERFDTGAILASPQVPIRPGASMIELFLEQAVAGGHALAEVVDAVVRDGALPSGRTQDLTRRSYHGMPTMDAVRSVRSHGHRLVARRDVAAYREALRRVAAPSRPAPGVAAPSSA
ncbi:hypothetical protein FTX61_03460 [Nitriliruptoraceae bacterium ZYF776]|nr:hypothetical protein [Profundirhabdus halotolerans]